MKLRNKKTGEIREARIMGEHLQLWAEALNNWIDYDDIDYLAKYWERYKEPKDFWYIDDFMIMCGTEGEFTTPDLASFTKKDVEKLKAIGNYFETKEEAEKVVEKLKAWKRLKDKGFRFDGYDVAHNSNGDLCGQLFYNAGDYCIEDVEKDLDLLFGGEE